MCQVEMKAEKNPVGLGIGSMYWVLYRVQWSRRLFSFVVSSDLRECDSNFGFFQIDLLFGIS